MAVQTTYSENITAGVVGQLADTAEATCISRTVQAATLAFGVPINQGTADGQCRQFTTGDTVTSFIGVSVRDRSVTEGDGYIQYESARIMREGVIWVTASVQVAAGDQVAVTSAGAWSNVAGTNGIVVPNARWETSTSGAGKIAKISIC